MKRPVVILAFAVLGFALLALSWSVFPTSDLELKGERDDVPLGAWIGLATPNTPSGTMTLPLASTSSMLPP